MGYAMDHGVYYSPVLLFLQNVNSAGLSRGRLRPGLEPGPAWGLRGARHRQEGEEGEKEQGSRPPRRRPKTEHVEQRKATPIER